MNTQCPFESSSRSPLKSATGRLITAILAVAAICILSFNSAQAQSINNNPTDCSDPAETQLSPQTQAVLYTGKDPSLGVGFFWLNSILSPLFTYIPTIPPNATTVPPQSTATRDVTAQLIPCSEPPVRTKPQ